MMIEEGERLRAGLPAYLIQRLALLGVYCSLLALAQLRAIVHGSEKPITTEML
jgi:hypothetical protein